MTKINPQKYKKIETVVILPYVNGKVLMQLRDDKRSIIFPGQWGFFGGSINNSETPEEAARRELFEEIYLNPKSIHKFYNEKVPEIGNNMSHAYCFLLTVPIQDIKLFEGMDLGLFSIEEVRSGKLYSPKMKKEFPVMKIPHIMNTINALINFIN